MDFMLGCNYWASHAGVDMWREWDSQVVDRDLKTLSENGVSYIRVFPNWRDFQPVKPLYAGNAKLYEYRMEGDRYPENPYFLDEAMLKHFEQFCSLAQKYHIKLIVGLITGWMSGRLFIPSALNGKNIYTDSTALMFQQKFIRGFVSRFKDNQAISYWDLGNECNNMSPTTCREEAYTWTAVIANAIRAQDRSRPVISGMHSLTIDGHWTMEDQGECTDMVTTHPYPFWGQHTSNDKMLSVRTLLHATAETVYFGTVSGKPCLVEELGTMGPMICNEETAARFMRVNLFSNWANGAMGVLWWCANEQSHLTAPPYDWNMCERELGMLDNKGNPKSMLLEMKKFSRWLKSTAPGLISQKTEGVCLLTKNQDHWGVAYSSYILAKQAGVSLIFADGEKPLPQAPVYLLPSISGPLVINKARYDELLRSVYEGAILYISMNNGFLTEFQELTGLSIIDSEEPNEAGQMIWGENKIDFARKKRLILETKSAEVLAVDGENNPVFAKNSYGKGVVYYLNFPMEEGIIQENEAFRNTKYEIYREVFQRQMQEKILTWDNPDTAITLHGDEKKLVAVIVNYSNSEIKTDFKVSPTHSISQILYGQKEKIDPCDAIVLELTKNQAD
jgi:endo-1,4-beta-mannosidase